VKKVPGGSQGTRSGHPQQPSSMKREAEGLTLQEVAEQHAIVERSLRLIGNNPPRCQSVPGAVAGQWGRDGGCVHGTSSGLPGRRGPAPTPGDLLCLRRTVPSHEGLPPRRYPS